MDGMQGRLVRMQETILARNKQRSESADRSACLSLKSSPCSHTRTTNLPVKGFAARQDRALTDKSAKRQHRQWHLEPGGDSSKPQCDNNQTRSPRNTRDAASQHQVATNAGVVARIGICHLSTTELMQDIAELKVWSATSMPVS
jgi:hypothetical protein